MLVGSPLWAGHGFHAQESEPGKGPAAPHQERTWPVAQRPKEAFTASDVLALYLHRGALRASSGR
jgi:hypothetical protein